MAYTLVPMPPNLVRSAITLDEAYTLLEAADPRAPAVDDLDAIDIRLIARRWLAAQVLHDGLPCFVWSRSSGWFRIPKRYWWKPDWTMEELVNRVGLNPVFDYDGVLDAPSDMTGQDVVVWREAVEALIAINTKPPAVESPRHIAAAVSDRTGGPGAPSTMHLIEAEMRRRHSEGSLADTLGSEARALAEWFDNQPEYKRLRKATLGTIQNAQRDLYRKLKATK